MSALNFYHQGHRAIILQDAACYDEDGVLLSLGPKHVVVSEANVVVTCTGMANAPQIMATIIRRGFRDIDDFADRGEAFFAEHWSDLQRTIDELGSGRLCAMVVGWSKRDRRPKSVHFTNREGEPSFIVDLAWLHHPKLRSGAKASLLRQIGEPTREEFDPVQHGIALMEVQRRQPSDGMDEGKSGRLLIGGHVMLITVDRHGITDRILKRWDDRVGETIEPGPLPATSAGIVVAMPAVNRRERRRQDALRRGAVA
ncbi:MULTISPECIES: hypothetical protein [unclassified Aureimonas]|uniref:hypothetical protein n=1 Tax=unclassified Aureimonas TaxID=2615206 RepID=UPI0006F434AD|nr:MULTISPECIES: hypothetical protein [unclassified Aureimonas]KQT57474.1 hypothetical protein ASG62_09145 [Aureimonas sp. Leaf427]KQT77154.1 hypothetical protein ASG54_13015 [Aureimonas sp. Leaf460]